MTVQIDCDRYFSPSNVFCCTCEESKCSSIATNLFFIEEAIIWRSNDSEHHIRLKGEPFHDSESMDDKVCKLVNAGYLTIKSANTPLEKFTFSLKDKSRFGEKHYTFRYLTPQVLKKYAQPFLVNASCFDSFSEKDLQKYFSQ